MDYSKLKRLEEQVRWDIERFIPKGHFNTTLSLSFNGKELLSDEKRGILAMALAQRLSNESKAGFISVTPKQSIAIDLLYWLGNLASIEVGNKNADLNEKEVINELYASLKEYFVYLGNEAEPFKPLLTLFDEELNKTKKQIANIRGVEKQFICEAFSTLYFNKRQWQTNLSDPPRWLKKCRVSNGVIGSKKKPSLWNPITIGIELSDKGVSLEELNKVFSKQLKNWNEEWLDQTYQNQKR